MCYDAGQGVDAVVLWAQARAASSLAFGNGRDGASRAACDTACAAWELAGGYVLGHVAWPEDAASFLRFAKRLTAPAPDCWVLAGPPRGVSGVLRRLASSGAWDPTHSLLLADSAPDAALLAGRDAARGIEYLCRARIWRVVDVDETAVRSRRVSK